MGGKKPILCVDFDGVLHSYTSGWQGASVVGDPPVPGAMDFLVDALTKFDVQVYSSRSSQPGGVAAMRTAIMAWMNVEGHPWSVVLRIRFPTQKPAAFLTIDDRAVCFDGTFPLVTDLANFKPWYTREE
jgi:hypothetical protein